MSERAPRLLPDPVIFARSITVGMSGRNRDVLQARVAVPPDIIDSWGFGPRGWGSKIDFDIYNDDAAPPYVVFQPTATDEPKPGARYKLDGSGRIRLPSNLYSASELSPGGTPGRVFQFGHIAVAAMLKDTLDRVDLVAAGIGDSVGRYPGVVAEGWAAAIKQEIGDVAGDAGTEANQLSPLFFAAMFPGVEQYFAE